MASPVPALVPARMLNEYAYCPRLFYLEWVQSEWADNHFTEDGRHVHRRADKEGGAVPSADEPAPFQARSVMASAPIAGISTRVDVLEGDGDVVVPVEYKRGRPAPVPERIYEPERVQVCAQALALRENGYRVDHGTVYFAETRERVDLPIDDVLVARTRALLDELRACAESEEIPPPLLDSPKCAGCSLSGICLPDETHALREQPADSPEPRLRRLHPARDDALPLYVQEAGGRMGISGDVLVVNDRDGGKLAEARLKDTSQVGLFGNIQVTTPALRRLCEEGVPLSFFSYGGWYYGRLEGHGHKNIEVRRAQFRAAESEGACLRLAKRLVGAKIANCRTLLRRNHGEPPRRVLDGLKDLRARVQDQTSLASLLGVEGSAARLYFEAFPEMLRPSGDGEALRLDFEGRNRRPPPDPVNAVLSFAYGLLTKDFTVVLSGVGLDPYLGFYHQPRYGRPALALDLMEEFRPLIADSVALQVFNTGVLRPGDFIRNGLGVALKPAGRKRLLQAYERRMDQLVTHPVFGYRISYRRVLEVQARLLTRHLLGEIDEYPEFTTR